ncbi:MAG TPA: hypothetical protein VHN74_18995 [Candidatus Angelobacter sp.]|jgi:DNA-directed RNA polymerase specialized sigma24 family protein|nr:hypothetical protein [Candidatus Angelobacter sp.]
MKSTTYSLGAAPIQRSRGYASIEAFCAIFRQDMDSLYTLALCLTASHDLAQQCFEAALNDCRTGTAVFAEWARSWSRRAVIKSAIRLLDPVRFPMNGGLETGVEAVALELNSSARWLFRLDRIQRFVFVISVLEGYAVRECAALLGASPREVEQARVRALQAASNNQDIPPASHFINFEKAAQLNFRAPTWSRS